MDKDSALKRIQYIHPHDFEKLVSELYESLGYETELTEQTDDGGVDILVSREEENLAIQAKRYKARNKVSQPQMREYAFLTHDLDEVDRIVVVTTSSFTEGAQKIADRHNVELINGAELVQLIFKTEIEDIAEIYAPTVHQIERDSKNSGICLSDKELQEELNSSIIFPRSMCEKCASTVFSSRRNSFTAFASEREDGEWFLHSIYCLDCDMTELPLQERRVDQAIIKGEAKGLENTGPARLEVTAVLDRSKWYDGEDEL